MIHQKLMNFMWTKIVQILLLIRSVLILTDVNYFIFSSFIFLLSSATGSRSSSCIWVNIYALCIEYRNMLVWKISDQFDQLSKLLAIFISGVSLSCKAALKNKIEIGVRKEHHSISYNRKSLYLLFCDTWRNKVSEMGEQYSKYRIRKLVSLRSGNFLDQSVTMTSIWLVVIRMIFAFLFTCQLCATLKVLWEKK